jgi:hypothetical protein
MPDSTAAIRSWAKSNGHDVAERGRLSVEVRDVYAKAQKPTRATKAPAPKKATPAKSSSSPLPKPSVAKVKTPAPAAKSLSAASPVVPVLDPPPVEEDALYLLTLRVAVLEKQVGELHTRLAPVEAKKRSLGRRRSA